MSGRLRRTSRAQGERNIVRSQSGFLGGMNLDVPASEIDDTELALAENVITYRSYLDARPGTEYFSKTNLTGTFRSNFYHPGQKAIVEHAGTQVVVSTDNGSTWTEASGSTSVLDAESKMFAKGDDVVIYQADKMLIIEMTNSFYLREYNSANPTVPINVTNVGDEGDAYVYRFIYSFARYVDDVLIAESGTITNPQANQSDYTELSFKDPYGSDNQIIINSFTPPTGTHWTHIRLYRTYDIGVNKIDEGEVEALYYNIGDFTFAQAENFRGSFGIGGMSIGSTFIISSGASPVGMTDDELKNRLRPTAKTYNFVPIPTGLVGAFSPGYMFVAKKGGRTIYYTGIGGVPERAGYYSALQFETVDDGLYGLVASPDSVIALCSNSTYRGIPADANERGNEFGTSIPIIDSFTLSDSTIGCIDVGSVSQIEQSQFIAHCSDSTIRAWDGVKWGIDLARQKVSKEIKKISTGSIGVYHPDGYYILWYTDDSTSTVTTKTLRLGLSEETGKGWSFYQGTGWSFPHLKSGALRIIDSDTDKFKVIVYDNSDSSYYWVETYDGPSGSGMSRVNVDKSGTGNIDISGRVRPKELRGSFESFFVRHQESHFYLRPIERMGSFLSGLEIDVNVYKDDVSVIQSTYKEIDIDGDVHLDEDVFGKRLTVEMAFNKGGFSLVGMDTRARAEDSANNSTDRTQEQHQENLGANLVFWSSRPSPFTNRANAQSMTFSTVEPTRITGADENADTGISLIGTGDPGIGTWVIGTTFTIV